MSDQLDIPPIPVPLTCILHGRRLDDIEASQRRIEDKLDGLNTAVRVSNGKRSMIDRITSLEESRWALWRWLGVAGTAILGLSIKLAWDHLHNGQGKP